MLVQDRSRDESTPGYPLWLDTVARALIILEREPVEDIF